MNCEKKMLNIYRQGKTFTDQFYVDEDYNVPDTKADIREIIEGDAVMEEIDLKLVENYIRITGRLAFQVLYVADNSDNTLSSLEGKIPFEEMYYVDETLEETLFLKAAQTEADCQSDPFPGKINVKAMAEVTMSSDSQVSEEVTTGIESGEQILYKIPGEADPDSSHCEKRYIPHQRAADQSPEQKKVSETFCGKKYLAAAWTQGWRQIH